MWQRFFTGSPNWPVAIVAILLTLIVAAAAARTFRILASHLLARIASDGLKVRSVMVQAPLRVVSAASFLVLFEVLLFPALELAGLEPRGPRRLLPVANWLLDSGVKVLAIFVIAYLVYRAAAIVVERMTSELAVGTPADAAERNRRAQTVGSVVTKLIGAFITVIALMMILKEFGFDIRPLLTGAGVAGVAVGIGAQALIRDFIGGFFLTLEDQVRKGDAVAINGTEGVVEDLNLRTIVLRDLEGALHVIPNGGIETLVNRSREFSFCVIDLAISYRDDPDQVTSILREVSAELRTDPEFGPDILAPVEVMGVQALNDRNVTMRCRIKTLPMKQWAIGREFRKRLWRSLEQHGVGIPGPERIVAIQQGPATAAG